MPGCSCILLPAKIGQAKISLVAKLIEASVCGRRAGKWSAGEETAGTEPERNAAVEPQTEARRRCGSFQVAGRDERAFCEAERARSRGRRGRPSAREVKQESALVTAEQVFVRL
jgi:hypothetical protein